MLARIGIKRDKNVRERNDDDDKIESVPGVLQIGDKAISENFQNGLSRKNISEERVSDGEHIFQLLVRPVPIHGQKDRVDNDAENDENFEHFGADND